ncbi:aromatic ring-hydroxylating oxygenase subunit alpha [Nocardioides sp. GXZ039]|uniref:aromatic ring-hydroxylating oxygenase subunit alpha n=1 Tax=Nocardioides sp. GXZ039 TaxID=3136018 RepID=UPI0030F3F11A
MTQTIEPREFASDQAGSSSPTDDVFAPTLAGEAYTSQDIFEQELVRIFEREWVYVGRAEEIARKGDFLRADVGRESVIVVRGRDEQIRGFLNVCRHRGARLCLEQRGNAGNAIRCPYHAWSYRLDGGLITAPNWEAMASIDKAERSLVEVRTEVWNGMVWVNLDDDAGPLADYLQPQVAHRLGDNLEVLERYDIANLVVGKRVVYEVEANWKLIFENFQECYHCGTIHPELVEAIPAFQASDTSANGYDTDGYYFAEGREGFTLSGKRSLPRLPGLREDDDLKYFGMTLRSNAFLSLTPDHVITHKFEPISATRTRAVCDWLVPAEVAASEDHDLSDAVALFDAVNKQDFDAAEWCQPNMSSRVYRDGGVLAPAEKLQISLWYDWYRDLMARES